MKSLDIDDYLKTSGVKVVIKGKEYVVKDFPSNLDDSLSNEELIAKLTGCPVEDLKGYGTAALLKIYDFLYTNLVPKNFQAPLSEGLRRQDQ